MGIKWGSCFHSSTTWKAKLIKISLVGLSYSCSKWKRFFLKRIQFLWPWDRSNLILFALQFPNVFKEIHWKNTNTYKHKKTYIQDSVVRWTESTISFEEVNDRMIIIPPRWPISPVALSKYSRATVFGICFTRCFSKKHISTCKHAVKKISCR